MVGIHSALELLSNYTGEVSGPKGLLWSGAFLKNQVQAWQEKLRTHLHNTTTTTATATRVAVRSDNHPQLLALDLAASMLGITLVPIPLFFTDAQQAHAVHNAQACGLVYASADQKQPWQWQPFAQTTEPNPLNQPSQPKPIAHKITFTSGTTGQPKGIVLTWDQQMRVAQQLHQALEELNIRKHLCLLPWAVLLENIAGLYAPMLGGADIAMPSLAEVGWRGASQFDAHCAIKAIREHQANSIIVMPGMLLQLIEALQSTGQDASALPNLRFIAVGGGHVPLSHLQQAAKLGLPVYEGYGLSECASVVCLNTPTQHRPGSVGQALPGYCIRVDEHQQLWVKAKNNVALSQGYHQASSVNSVLPHEPNQAPQPWVATGDIAEINEAGFVYIRGRQKNVIITAFGRNISPEWPEQILLNTGVFAQVLVYGIGGSQLCALLVPQANSTAQSIAQAVLETNTALPDYARIADYQCITEPWTHANRLLTANGRLQRQRILEHYHVPFVL